MVKLVIWISNHFNDNMSVYFEDFIYNKGIFILRGYFVVLFADSQNLFGMNSPT